MLKSLYVDNYKSLVNFNMEFDNLNLFLGRNGTGKSTVFEVLRKIRGLIVNQDKTGEFLDTTCAWQTQPVQRVDFELKTSEGTFVYKLLTQHSSIADSPQYFPQIQTEQLYLDDQLLFHFLDGSAHLFNDMGFETSVYPHVAYQSALSSVPERQDMKKLAYFKSAVAKWIMVHPVPLETDAFNGIESEYPDLTLNNFIGWYRHLIQDGGFSKKLNEDLEDVLSDFDSFILEPITKEERILILRFKSSDKKTVKYSFYDLSDGQRMLIILYTLLNLPEHEEMKDITLFIDEPDNFIALREVQPWLQALKDRCDDGDMQAVLISHNRDTIDYLLMPSEERVGYWFDRDNMSPTRIQAIKTKTDENDLPLSELMARDWYDA